MIVRLKRETIKSMSGQIPLFKEIMEDFNLESIETVRRWLRENKPNGPLTSKAALNIISKGLSVPEEYLINVSESV